MRKSIFCMTTYILQRSFLKEIQSSTLDIGWLLFFSLSRWSQTASIMLSSDLDPELHRKCSYQFSVQFLYNQAYFSFFSLFHFLLTATLWLRPFALVMTQLKMYLSGPVSGLRWILFSISQRHYFWILFIYSRYLFIYLFCFFFCPPLQFPQIILRTALHTMQRYDTFSANSFLGITLLVQKIVLRLPNCDIFGIYFHRFSSAVLDSRSELGSNT